MCLYIYIYICVWFGWYMYMCVCVSMYVYTKKYSSLVSFSFFLTNMFIQMSWRVLYLKEEKKMENEKCKKNRRPNCQLYFCLYSYCFQYTYLSTYSVSHHAYICMNVSLYVHVLTYVAFDEGILQILQSKC